MLTQAQRPKTPVRTRKKQAICACHRGSAHIKASNENRSTCDRFRTNSYTDSTQQLSDCARGIHRRGVWNAAFHRRYFADRRNFFWGASGFRPNWPPNSEITTPLCKNCSKIKIRQEALHAEFNLFFAKYTYLELESLLL